MIGVRYNFIDFFPFSLLKISLLPFVFLYRFHGYNPVDIEFNGYLQNTYITWMLSNPKIVAKLQFVSQG